MATTTGATNPAALVARRLRAGDRVRLVSPASSPEREQVARGAEMLTSWGLEVEIGRHAFDRRGHYLAGCDEDRLADLNDALRDPGVRAILATTAGKGAYRIAGALDFAAARRNPKPLVGFSDNTILHLALWQQCRLVGFHGPHAAWHDWYGSQAGDALRRALMDPEPVTVHQDPGELTAKVLVQGPATTGILMGGNLDTIGRSVGWACPSFDATILLRAADRARPAPANDPARHHGNPRHQHADAHRRARRSMTSRVSLSTTYAFGELPLRVDSSR